MLVLDDESKLKAGYEKHIYQHPATSELLVKVINPTYIENNPSNLFVNLLRFRVYKVFVNEIVEYIALRESQAKEKRYMQEIVGLEDTNFGLGMVVKAVRKHDGSLADNIDVIIKNKAYTDTHAREINLLMTWLEKTYVIVSDLSVFNIVWNEIDEHFVIIDGIGIRDNISLRMWSEKYNRFRNRRKISTLQVRIRDRLKKTG